MADEILCSKCGSPNPKDTVFCGKCGTRLVDENTSVTHEDPLIGSFVGDRFLVHEKLGEGGMGIVYRAEQTAIQREVALKVLHANLTQDESLHARFQNEAAASSRLNHPNTITIYDFGKTKSNSLYIAMEFIKGRSLDDEIQENGPMDPKRACNIAIQICGSLQDAHDNNIVHRDLKPENVMLCRRGSEKDVVKVLDFGIAKILEDESTDQRKALTKTGMVFGTPQYMSPEQIRGEKVDNRTDIYSLGVILYQMLRGTLPFNADTPMGLLTKHLMDTPEPLESHGIPKEIDGVVMKTLEKEPSLRPSSMKELSDLLAAASGIGGPAAITEALPVQNAPAPRTVARHGQVARKKSSKTSSDSGASKSGRVAAIAVALVLLAAGGAAAWYFAAGPGSGQTESVPVASTVPPPQQPASLLQLGQPSPIPTTAPPAPAVQPASPQTTEPVAPTESKGQQKSKTKGKGSSSKGANPSLGDLPNGVPKEIPKDLPKEIPKEVPKEIPKELKGKIPSEVPKGVVDKIENEPPKTAPPAVKTDAPCKFNFGGDAVDKAIGAGLRKREAAIKKCAVANDKTRVLFRFNVDQDGTTLDNLSAVTGPAAASSCLMPHMGQKIPQGAKESKTGTIVVLIQKTNNVVDSCSISVKTIPRPGKSARVVH